MTSLDNFVKLFLCLLRFLIFLYVGTFKVTVTVIVIFIITQYKAEVISDLINRFIYLYYNNASHVTKEINYRLATALSSMVSHLYSKLSFRVK